MERRAESDWVLLSRDLVTTTGVSASGARVDPADPFSPIKTTALPQNSSLHSPNWKGRIQPTTLHRYNDVDCLDNFNTSVVTLCTRL